MYNAAKKSRFCRGLENLAWWTVKSEEEKKKNSLNTTFSPYKKNALIFLAIEHLDETIDATSWDRDMTLVALTLLDDGLGSADYNARNQHSARPRNHSCGFKTKR